MPTNKSQKTKPPQLPPKVRAKTGTAGKTQAEKLETSSTCLAAQAQSPVGAQVAAEAAALKAARADLVTKNQERTDILAALEKKDIEILNAEAVHDTAIQDYTHRAAIVAKDDATVLKGLGAEPVTAQRSPRATGPADVPGNVRLGPGADTGSALTRWSRPDGAGAFVAQYRLEPAAGAPATDWTPAEGFATNKLSWQIDGLPPAAHLRVRVKAIGAEVGPWSDEVLGRAR
jgi:hypothetical protein